MARVPGSLSQADLDKRAWAIKDEVQKRAIRTKLGPQHRTIWESTLEEVKAGFCEGPLTEREVDRMLGTKEWIPTERFPREQKSKVRAVDNAAANQLNDASSITEHLMLASTDKNVGKIKLLKKLMEGEERELQGWVLDEKDAYRQLAVKPEHRKYAVIIMKNPNSGKIRYFVMTGHSFGLVAAVYNYNRRSALIDEILRTVFKVPANYFYDDRYGFEPKETAEQALEIVEKVHKWLGADYSKKKVQLSTAPTILGVKYNLPEDELEVTEQRKKDLKEEIEGVLREGELTSGHAAKLKGKLMFAASVLWGKVGRAFLRALSERQCTNVRETRTNEAIEEAL